MEAMLGDDVHHAVLGMSLAEDRTFSAPHIEAWLPAAVVIGAQLAGIVDHAVVGMLLAVFS